MSGEKRKTMAADWIAGESASIKNDRSELEHMIEHVLGHHRGAELTDATALGHVREVNGYDVTGLRVAVLGGGTGLSTIVGGNSKLPAWMERPFSGLKSVFPRLDALVCSTDDGGSTGDLLKFLPVIALGDLRKCCLSMIRSPLLFKQYGGDEKRIMLLVRAIYHLFNYRFPKNAVNSDALDHPLNVVPETYRQYCPARLSETMADVLSALKISGGYAVNPAGHCMGNLILAGAVFQASGGDLKKMPSAGAVQAGLDRVAEAIGSPAGRIHAATAVPGQLVFKYTHGVEVVGQSKSGRARRGFPIERVQSSFIREPSVSAAALHGLQEADLIVYAPGSLYTSIIPVLQIPSIIQAIQSNRKALKVLGANFWAQAGETDMSINNMARPFLVSELIEAYERNVACDVQSLFDVVLIADLAHVPGSILRAYALENKRPIHLDRAQVETMNLLPVEASLFPRDAASNPRSIKHDADNFALAIKALAYARHKQMLPARPSKDAAAPGRYTPAERHRGTMLLCHYYRSIRETLEAKELEPAGLRESILQLAWENRDVRTEHMSYFKAVRIVPDREWTRSREWDHVLGYYRPEDEAIYLHQSLFKKPNDWTPHLLIALGESLLGNYADGKSLYDTEPVGRCYEIRLRDESERKGYLNGDVLREFLMLAGMRPAAHQPVIWRMGVSRHEGFLPPGLLFGLMYAWYLDNRFAQAVDYEMGLLRWKPEDLLPHQAGECRRRRALVDFFRTRVFGHPA